MPENTNHLTSDVYKRLMEEAIIQANAAVDKKKHRESEDGRKEMLEGKLKEFIEDRRKVEMSIEKGLEDGDKEFKKNMDYLKRERNIDMGNTEDKSLSDQVNEWEKDLSEQERAAIKADMENGVGVKYDGGKLRYAEILPVLWIRRLTEVLEYGCSEKYSMHNWKGLDPARLLNAGFRHLLEVTESMQEEGNPLCIDKESALFNIYQSAWNLMAAGYILEQELKAEVVDGDLSVRRYPVRISNSISIDAMNYLSDKSKKNLGYDED